MQFFYDSQIRRYITQTIRVFSNFVVKYSDGSLHRVPVLYGDADRQVASIMRQNSENVINSVPRISVYVTELKMDRDRMADATYVGKVNIRERDIYADTYQQNQGRTYTVERLMPTPFTLKMKVDIWASSTDQKLQILEQILVFFNPSLELQTSDNFIDWTSLTVLNLDDITWTSRTVPTGTNLTIDVATITVDTPIWISPPVKVKQLGVITNIIANIHKTSDASPYGYIDGLGIDTTGPTITMSDIITDKKISISEYNIAVYGNNVTLLDEYTNTVPPNPFDTPDSIPNPVNWVKILDGYNGTFIAGVSRIYLRQPDGSEIAGTASIDNDNPSVLVVDWDQDTYNSNTGIDSQGVFENSPGYNAAGSNRSSSPGTFDAIVNPLTYNPKRPHNESEDQAIGIGTRFLIIEDIGNVSNVDGPDGWKSLYDVDFIGHANDIIEWNGNEWRVIFNSNQESESMIWQTNIYTGVQYLWNGISWSKSFDGTYRSGSWKLIL